MQVQWLNEHYIIMIKIVLEITKYCSSANNIYFWIDKHNWIPLLVISYL